MAFDSLDNMFPDGPSLHDFVSTDPSELPTFDPATSHGVAADNIIDYCIYVDQDKTHNQSQRLETVRVKIMGLVDTICGGLDHIWHQDSFQLDIITPTNQESHLSGSVCFGDCIDDEWLIVWMLCDVTRLDPSLSVSVRDNDGEFLLIETSPSWPRSLNWLDPDTSNNRVWLRNGSLHIITDNPNNQERGALEESKALDILRRGDTVVDDNNTHIRKGDRVKIGGLSGRSELNGSMGKCMGAAHDRLVVEISKSKERLKVKPHNVFKVITSEAPTQVVDAFLKKLETVRQVMKVNKQVVKMVLPMEVALVLHESPHIVSAAVQILYCRSPTDTANAAQCKRFGTPSPSSSGGVVKRSQSLVEVSVSMTRCLLAMLNSQESFYPPKKMITAWSAQMVSGRSLEEANFVIESLPFRRGLLLTSALEMLYQAHQVRHVREGARIIDDMVRKHGCKQCIGISIAHGLSPSDECMFCSEVAWLRCMSERRVDDESWMNVTPEELEAILQKASPPIIDSSTDDPAVDPGDGNTTASEVNVNDSGQEKGEEKDEVKDEEKDVKGEENGEGVLRLGKIVDGIHDFLSKSSQVTGVELEEEQEEGISFDVQKFMSALQGKEYVQEEDEDVWGDPKNNDSDDDDDDDDEDDGGGTVEDDVKGDDGAAKGEDDEDINGDGSDEEFTREEYSKAMQKELDQGVLGKSFEKVSDEKSETLHDNNDDGNHDGDVNGEEGDEEEEDGEDEGEEGDEISPVDLDGNLVKHLLESYASQDGLAGPASNLLHEMGLFFPRGTTDKKDEEGESGQGPSNFFDSKFVSENKAVFPMGESEAMYQLD